MAIVSTDGIEVGDLYTTNGKDMYEVVGIVTNPQIRLRNVRHGYDISLEIGSTAASEISLEDLVPVIVHPGDKTVPVPMGVDLSKSKVPEKNITVVKPPK